MNNSENEISFPFWKSKPFITKNKCEASRKDVSIRFVFKSFNPNKRLPLPEGLSILIIVKEMRPPNKLQKGLIELESFSETLKFFPKGLEALLRSLFTQARDPLEKQI